MEQGKQGLKIWNEAGDILLEVGPHVISEATEFAEKIGVVAASWAQAEVNLNCFFAVLLNTTPDEASRQIKKHGSAARAADGARRVAAETLTGAELESVKNFLDKLDKVRARRNRVQHDVWARKGGDDLRIFAVHSNEYLAFVIELMAGADIDKAGGRDVDRAIILAEEFAAKISNGYTIEDLQDIAMEIDAVSKSLLQAMFSRISLRLAGRP